MEPAPLTPPGFVDSLRTLGDGLLATGQKRLELLSLELQEEKFRLIQIIVWISAVVLVTVMAVVFASLTLVYFFWESARFAVLGGLTIFYAGAWLVIVVAFRRYLTHQPSLFAATRHEIREDRACIRPKN